MCVCVGGRRGSTDSSRCLLADNLPIENSVPTFLQYVPGYSFLYFQLNGILSENTKKHDYYKTKVQVSLCFFIIEESLRF